jgi:hypothetical protein
MCAASVRAARDGHSSLFRETIPRDDPDTTRVLLDHLVRAAVGRDDGLAHHLASERDAASDGVWRMAVASSWLERGGLSRARRGERWRMVYGGRVEW